MFLFSKKILLSQLEGAKFYIIPLKNIMVIECLYDCLKPPNLLLFHRYMFVCVYVHIMLKQFVKSAFLTEAFLFRDFRRLFIHAPHLHIHLLSLLIKLIFHFLQFSLGQYSTAKVKYFTQFVTIMNFRTMVGITAFIKSSKVILWYDESHRLWPKWNYDETRRRYFYCLLTLKKMVFNDLPALFKFEQKFSSFSIEPKI